MATFILTLGSVFLCSVCAENVTWKGRSLQCSTCSKWFHFRCSVLSFSKFKTLGSSHSWNGSPCCVPAFFGGHTLTDTMSSSSSSSTLYTSFVQLGPSGTPLLTQHSRPRLQTSYPLSAHFVSPFYAPSPPLHVSDCFSIPPAFSFYPVSFRVLQWNAEGLQAKSAELQYFISSHSVDLICIQKSNLNSLIFFFPNP